MTITPESKLCGKCKETKPLTGFTRHHKTRDGYQTTCKVCIAARYRDSNAGKLDAWLADPTLVHTPAWLRSDREVEA